MRRVLITGGSGFVGTNAVDYFIRRNVSVVNLDVRPPACEGHRRFWRNVDILDASTLMSEVVKFAPTEVIHLAARTDLNESAGLSGYKSNIDGVRNLLAALADVPTVRTTFFASTMLVCEIGYEPRSDTDFHPNTVYGHSKVMGEQLVRSSTITSWVIGRLTSIWGPWFGEPYRRFFELVKKGLYANPSRFAAVKSFGYVENTVRQIDRLLLADPSLVHGRTFYLGDQPPMHIGEWADAVARESGVSRPRKMPLGLLRVAAKFGDIAGLLGVRFPMTSFRLRNMTTDHVVDLDPISLVAGPSQVSTEEGIRRTLRWLHTSSSTPRG